MKGNFIAARINVTGNEGQFILGLLLKELLFRTTLLRYIGQRETVGWLFCCHVRSIIAQNTSSRRNRHYNRYMWTGVIRKSLGVQYFF